METKVGEEEVDVAIEEMRFTKEKCVARIKELDDILNNWMQSYNQLRNCNRSLYILVLYGFFVY